MLQLIDQRWADYLTTLEHLKDDIRWQSLGQRDPLVEFKAEAFSAFQSFQESLKQEIVRYLFHAEIQVTPAEAAPLEGVAVHPEAGRPGEVGSDPRSMLPSEATLDAAAQALATPPQNSPSRPNQPARGPTSGGAAPATSPPGGAPVSRNALCPCGSGRKYKRCHGANQ
jgi:preprotein translocase subunit SecA